MGNCIKRTERARAVGTVDRNKQQQKPVAAAKLNGSKRNIYGDYDYLFKLLMVGDSGVGKSSLLLRYVDDVFHETFIATIGVDFKIKTLEVGQQQEKAKLQIWDTAGQERFRTITSSFYRGAHGVIVVFDVSNRSTFENIPRWIEEVNRYSMDRTPMVLVGNKIDCNRVVSREEAEALANSLGMRYVECSCRNSDGVTEVFQSIADSCHQRVLDDL